MRGESRGARVTLWSYRFSLARAKGWEMICAMAQSLKIPKAVQAAFELAKEARENAHAPYSKFQVGAGLLLSDGDVVTGCNVENASYGGTVCAERIAIFKAVSERQTGFTDIVVVTDALEPAYPCAFCLQVMAEFFNPETKIWVADLKSVRSVHKFKELLPKPFGPKQLANARAKRR